MARLGGFPVLVRPSYVLSGAAMSVAHEPRASSAHPRPRQGGLARASGGRLQVRDARPRDRDRRRRRRRRDRALGHQRAHRGRRRAQRRRDARAAAADALHRDHPPGAQDRRRRSPRRCDITGPFNMQFLAKHERGQGHRVQPARVAQLPVRLQGDGHQLRRRGDAPDARRCPSGREPLPRPRLRRGQGADVLVLAPRRRRPDARRRDGQHRRGRLLRRRPARGAAPRAARDGLPAPDEGRAALAGPLDRQVLVRRRGAGALGGAGPQALRDARHGRGAHGARHRVHRARQAPEDGADAAWTPSRRGTSTS